VILYFGLGISVLLLLAFAIIIPPLWRKAEIGASEIEQRNTEIARQRLNDLTQQRQAGVLTAAQFEAQCQEQELILADDLAAEKKSIQPSSQGRWVIVPIALLVPLVAILTYLTLGDPNAYEKAEIQASQPSKTDVEKMVAGLAERMKQQPDNAKGWFMLGRSQLYLEHYQQAADAFKQAYRLMGDKPDIMIHYANALILAHAGTIPESAARLIVATLSKQPDNATALWLAGLLKIQHNELSQAVSYWRKLAQQLPADSPSSRELYAKIAVIEESLAQPTGTAVSKNIIVAVKLAPSLAAKLPDQATLFIYAQALKGPPMPLAVIKKSVHDLPLTVTLDDSLAMMPAMKLSNFNQVKVVARVSRSGLATKQPGDLLGEVKLTDFTEKTEVTVVINQIL